MGRCGTIAIVGRPNVGKSTLLNRACGAHLSIVSPRPQTTRVQVRGVVTRGDDQLVFVDTPGYNRRSGMLSRAMHTRVVDAIRGSDLVLVVSDVFVAQRRAVEEKGAEGAYVHPEDRRIAEAVGGRGAILALNKIDLLRNRNLALPIMEALAAVPGVDEVVPVSARTGLNLDRLVDVLARALPEGVHLFPDDAMTDRPERFFAAEIVRETAFHLLREELPYSIAVVVEHWIEEKGRVVIEARIVVEGESQKGIVVGAGGRMVKEIGTEARRRMQEFLGRRIHLGLRVVVRKGWRDDPALVERLIETP